MNAPLDGIIDLIIKSAPAELKPSEITLAPSPEHLREHFDLSIPIGFLLASKIKGRKPLDLAHEILSRLSANDLIDNAAVAAPAYLNLRLKPSLHCRLVEKVLLEKTSFPQGIPWQNRGVPPSVLIEFCSANPTGPLHFGHARGSILGDTLARLFRRLDSKVSTEFYINDVGRQVELLGQSLAVRFRQEILGEQNLSIPQDGYGGNYLVDIARQIPPQSNLNDNAFFQNFAKEKILNLIRQDLDRLDIHFDQWFGESTLHQTNAVSKILDRLKSKGFVQENDGALWFNAKGLSEEDKERVLRRKDGRTTYFASDLAYHDDKFSRENSLLINIWGADHHGYIARMQLGLEALGHAPQKLQVILVQMVRLVKDAKPLTLSKRGGEYTTLGDIAGECGEEALRFFMNSRSPNSQLDFDLDLAKKQAPENPLFLIQYAHARICSIEREKTARQIHWKPSPAMDFFENDPKSRQLSCQIALFPDVLLTSANRFSAHYLTTYLIDLARLFHGYYETHSILSEPDPNLACARFDLSLATRQVIANGLSLLGLSSPEKM